MDASAITAFAALMGATIGGLTSVLASWLTQRGKARAQLLTHDIMSRENLYKEFIREASKCYIHALQHEEADIPALAELYAHFSSMRVISSKRVLETANQIERKIVDGYLVPRKSFQELREMVNSGSFDLLRDFTAACRAELQSLRARQF